MNSILLLLLLKLIEIIDILLFTLKRSIGVSNFNLKQIQELNNIARLKPSVNQVRDFDL